MSDDPKARCDRARAVRRANRGVVTKLVKEVDEIIGTDLLTDDLIDFKLPHSAKYRSSMEEYKTYTLHNSMTTVNSLFETSK